MNYVRIQAVHLDNGATGIDTMVLDLPLNAEGRIENGNIMGYAIDDGEMYPFVMRPCKDRQHSDISWGAYGEDECSSHTNLRDKAIKVGEMFTRVDCHEGGSEEEYTFLIERVMS